MANLRDIKRRITTVKSTQKITSAMKMVAAAKLRRAQDAIGNARPYATRMRATLEVFAAMRAARNAATFSGVKPKRSAPGVRRWSGALHEGWRGSSALA